MRKNTKRCLALAVIAPCYFSLLSAEVAQPKQLPARVVLAQVPIEQPSATKKRKLKPDVTFGVSQDKLENSSNAFIPQPQDQLQPLSESFSLSNSGDKSEFAIIGQDSRFRPGRTTRYPLTAIGRLEIESDAGRSICSATLISPNKLITAAHCVYQKDKRSFVKNIYFTPGRDGDYIPYGIYAVKAAYIPKEYLNSDFTNNNADIAVLSLNTPIGNELGYLGFASYQPLPKDVSQQITGKLNSLIQQANGDTNLQRRKVTEYMENAPASYADYSLSYFGYSGDKKGEVWGDTCLHFLAEKYSTERYPLIQTFCDYQRGASGSAFIDSERKVRGVNSFHSGTQGTAIVTESGKASGNFKGDVYSVQNYSVGISDYTFGLILKWRNDQFGQETLVKNFSSAGDLKQVRIKNNCREALWIAARFKDINGDWVNMGFYKKAPYKESVFTVTSDYYYYYAQDQGANKVWKGSDSYQKLFDKTYGFKKRKLGSSFENKINLQCG